ncbi:hypothetical protein A2765_02790 [Candidatus Kaiserbacteria bacterium RIFCSPHIGHO2_01_FULL_56_24]|uniref:phosphoribosylglycinamide formyltransferase 1 n=1 Tax=Candidatus Kaiserbacteria bacterium RIFCSPHIGHO2_01_FULL_56_24 TaxID=1798487 RepID=A0A1F6DB54_9BACT|nr:MAG: hypothetical protein A2765_02790 [Candidatus Kaiserbacteria bacterium RIFCSPHIGHO2_01_FULL_56_24]
MKVAILVSGEGSTLRRFVKRELPITVVIADRPYSAYTSARSAHLPAHLIEREDFSPSFDREAYTQKVLQVLIEYGIDLVVMAGWKTLLSPTLFYVFGDMVLNSHPSLLPDFKGPNAVRDALEASRRLDGPIYTGCTVFRATAKMDEG